MLLLGGAVRRLLRAVDPFQQPELLCGGARVRDGGRQEGVPLRQRACATPDLKEAPAVVSSARTCAASAAAKRREAATNVQAMFADAGYKDGSVAHAVSAASGKRQ
jgi:hypothetical protein